MKTKKSILGVGITLVLLASLLLAVIPVSADAGTLKWSSVKTPNPTYNQLVAGDNVSFVVVADDGMTMFAYGNTSNTSANLLYKSTDGGMNWVTSNIGDTLEGKALVAMAISPDYANDSTVVAATANVVYRSINGGQTFGEVAASTLVSESGAGANGISVTSVACSPYYLGGSLAILVGTSDNGSGEYGGVFLFTNRDLTWIDLEVANGAAGTAYDVLAVAFSPDHMTDAQFLALATDETDCYLTTKFSSATWGSDVLDALISGLAPTSGTMAFPADYEWSANNRILIGTAGGAKDDVYRIHGGLAGSATLEYDLEVNGTNTETEVHSISIQGDIAEAEVLVGQKDATTVKRCTDPTTSSITWKSASKVPTGDSAAPNTIVIWSPTDIDLAYAATNGTKSAFSRSIDGGVTFNQVGLIDVSALSAMSIVDVAVADANNMYMIMADSGAVAGALEMLFKTSNGGSAWERVWTSDGMSQVIVSPEYATDDTVYVATTTTRMWRSTNGGTTFAGLTAPLNVSALAVVDKSTYFTGHAGRVYKSGVWTYATVSGTVQSIALSPNYAEDDTLFVGNDAGSVYYSTDDGAKFYAVGPANSLAVGNNVVVAVDPSYATSNIVYAGSDGATDNTTVGIYRFEMGESSLWELVDDGAATDELWVKDIAITAGRVMYAASDYATGKGVRRILYPWHPILAKRTPNSMTTDLPAGSQIKKVAVITGDSNEVYAVTATSSAGSYGYTDRLIGFGDILAVAPVLVSPDDATSIPYSTKAKLSWEAVPSPAETITYTYQVATDSGFDNKVVNSTTTGTAITDAILSAATQYYWRVYTSDPLYSLFQKRSFTTAFAAIELKAPAYGEDEAVLKPSFAWIEVAGATSYEFELADNADFTGATAKTLTGNVFTSATDLKYASTYYWRVRALKDGNPLSAWASSVFSTLKEGAEPAPPVVIETTPPPQINIPPAPEPAPVQMITPAYIWAIIAIGAVLVIAVIVLIVRTRRPI